MERCTCWLFGVPTPSIFTFDLLISVAGQMFFTKNQPCTCSMCPSPPQWSVIVNAQKSALCFKALWCNCSPANVWLLYNFTLVLKGTGKAIFISGYVDDLTKIHPLASPITFGKDVELLPHAKVSSDTISRNVQAEYSIPQLCKSVHVFSRGFPHKTKIFSETVRGVSFKFVINIRNMPCKNGVNPWGKFFS